MSWDEIAVLIKHHAKALQDECEEYYYPSQSECIANLRMMLARIGELVDELEKDGKGAPK